jgi:GxxExxY protein
MEGNLIFEKLSYELIGICMEIHRVLGTGHKEVIYKDALEIELSRKDIDFSRERKFRVNYKGIILPHCY